MQEFRFGQNLLTIHFANYPHYLFFSFFPPFKSVPREITEEAFYYLRQKYELKKLFMVINAFVLLL